MISACTPTTETLCGDCLAGTAISGIAATTCDLCEIGKFATGSNNTVCTYCDDDKVLKGSTTKSTGSTSIFDCQCEAGDFKSDESSICENVFAGVSSTSDGMTVPTLSIEPGFWRSSETSKKVLPCLDKRHCKGGSNVTDLCTEGYTGPLCAVCQPNYASTGSGQTLTCTKCGGSAFATIAAISTTFFVIITASICYCLRRSGETPIEKKGLTAHDDLNRLRTFSTDAKKKAKAMATFVDEAGPILKILQYLDPGQRNFTFELRNEEEGMKKAIEKRKELEELHPHVKRLSFLYSSYEPQCYWFEVVETVRKLVLTAGLIFFQPGTAAQIVLSILVCLLSMRVYSGWKPFVSEEHDKLAEVAQWQLFFVMFAALLIRVNMDGESLQDKVYFDIMLVIIQFGAPALLVAQRLIPKKKGRIGRFFSAAADLTGFGAFGVFEAAEGLKNEFGDDVVEMVNNPLDKNRQLRAASSGRFGLGEEVVAKKLKKKKKKKKDDGERGEVDTAKDKKLFQRLESGGYNKKAVIGVGKKGLLEVKKAAAVPTPQTKEDEVEKKMIYAYKDAEGREDYDMEEEEDEVPPAPPQPPTLEEHKDEESIPPPPPTWEEHKDEESGQFYYHNAKTNETRWEKPN
ncbi:hypothetical protein TrCOL_g8025 [Triparma columacea]|uniref:WW domain-containing protein n=1 Tax=Triparma columacea TaxID=722753 RepID=A0A9W7G559_9STRA|nr:hypothetical protein TrCOL_g8025 [Triparma columacea]